MAQIAVVQRTFAVLEAVAASGSASAKEVAGRLEIPLPSVYRLLQELVVAGYLVHLREQGSFELGPKCFDLGLSFRQRVIAPQSIRHAADQVHRALGAAAYFAVYRGEDIVLTYLSDCEKHPRLRPLRFGFHEAAHATAFGKILLAGMEQEQREVYLRARGTPRLTPQTLVDSAGIEAHLDEVAARGIAWEHEEFLPGQTCAAVPVRNGTGMAVAAIAMSIRTPDAAHRHRQIETVLREHAGRCSRYLRMG
ncbi:IclR family transcriptional regulator [Rothia halotolerans]|uniref:IclR family transcriptional regulator n=1 Tax=Rothia halotolerans TaxID=405770 RepID=UPI00101DD8E0|nr:IclR family transcriptional regulator [Rothia halotolerans]